MWTRLDKTAGLGQGCLRASSEKDDSDKKGDGEEDDEALRLLSEGWTG